mmetsp:Transcript_16412/g.33008  ORF Transcript_16412/g.33008 Transcript_16412/m.33008 type:complete len:171 (+) Transcript_16412:52-564(+)
MVILRTRGAILARYGTRVFFSSCMYLWILLFTSSLSMCFPRRRLPLIRPILCAQLKIWRNVDSSTGAVHPGLVNAQNVREKLSQQLKIDLEDHETVQLRAKPVELGHAELEEEDVERIMEGIGSSGDEESAGEGDGAECKVEIRQLGEFMAKISLRGGHVVPLKFAVLKR